MFKQNLNYTFHLTGRITSQISFSQMWKARRIVSFLLQMNKLWFFSFMLKTSERVVQTPAAMTLWRYTCINERLKKKPSIDIVYNCGKWKCTQCRGMISWLKSERLQPSFCWNIDMCVCRTDLISLSVSCYCGCVLLNLKGSNARSDYKWLHQFAQLNSLLVKYSCPMKKKSELTMTFHCALCKENEKTLLICSVTCSIGSGVSYGSSLWELD